MSIDPSERLDNVPACHERIRALEQVIEEHRRELEEAQRQRAKLTRKYRTRRKQLLNRRHRESR